MKYCLINNLYAPDNLGGAERVVELIANGLAKDNQVVVITTLFKNTPNFEDSGNIKIYRVRPNNIYHYLAGFKKSWWQKIIWQLADIYGSKTARQVEAILKIEKPDFVFTHNLKGFSLGIAKVIAQLKIFHVHTLHDYQLIEPHGSLFRKGKCLSKFPWWLKFYTNRCRKIFENVNLVVSPSDFVLQKHLAFGFFKNPQVLVLKNPVVSIADLGKHISSEKIRLLYLGQIESHKGVEFLLQAFTEFNHSDFDLTIVGGGSLLEELKTRFSAERIKFYGKLERQKLPEIFKETDFIVVPSLWWENSPTVIYEGYSFGVPVIVSDSGGSQELVSAGKTGYIFKSGDRASLILIWHKIAQNRANFAELRQSAAVAGKALSLDGYLNNLLEKCHSLLK